MSELEQARATISKNVLFQFQNCPFVVFAPTNNFDKTQKADRELQSELVERPPVGPLYSK